MSESETESTESDTEADDGLDIDRLADLSEELGEYLTDLKRAIVEDDDESDLLELADDLWDVLDEVEDVLDTIDFEELPEAIDLDELEEEVDIEDIPEGLLDEDETAIDLSTIREATNLRELWDAVDLTELREEKKELENEIDDVQEDLNGEDGENEEDDGLLGDDEEDDGLFGDDDEEDNELIDTDNVIGTEGAHVQFDAEARQAFLEEKILSAVQKFRSVLLSTHDKLHRLYEMNQEKLGQPGRQPDSLNPTAYSSLPSGPVPDSASTRRSTVPAQVRYSKVENPRRIYGRRFTKAKRDAEDTETEADEVDEESEEGETEERDQDQDQNQEEEAIEVTENDE